MKRTISVIISVLSLMACSYALARHKLPSEAHRRVENGYVKTARSHKKPMASSPNSRGDKSFIPRSVVLPQGDKAIFGYLSYSTQPGFMPGMYSLSDSGYELHWIDPFFIDQEVQIRNGFLKDDKICAYAVETYAGYLFATYYLEVDFASGELLTYEEIPYGGGYFYALAYNLDEEMVYGYGIDGNDDPCFMKVNPDNPTYLESVKTLENIDELCYSMTFNSIDGNLYGVNRCHEFVRIDTDGAQSVLAKASFSDVAEPYISGLVYVPSQNYYLWQATYIDGTTSLFTISSSGEMTHFSDCPSEEAFNFFVTLDQPVNLEVPVRPEIKSINFAAGSHTGSITLQLPSVFKNGEEISDNLDYSLQVDDEAIIKGTASAGDVVNVDIDCSLDDGYHNFTAWVSYQGHGSPSVSKRQYIGNDMPEAPTEVRLTKDSVSWTPVTSSQGINGGYVELEKLVYIVSVNGEKIGETSEDSYPITLPDSKMTAYTAAVYASCNGFESEPALSNKIVEGDPLMLPVSLIPTEEEFSLMTVYDSNSANEEDGLTWNHDKFYLDGDQVWIIPNTYDGVASADYLFLPYFYLSDSDKYYTWSIQVKGDAEDTSNEVLEVYLCNSISPSGLMEKIMKIDNLTTEFQTFDTAFKVPEPGIYSIALFYGTRYVENDNYDLGGVYARNMLIADEDIVAESPGCVANLEAVPASPGALKALLSFKFPTEDISGKRLAEDKILTAHVCCKSSTSIQGKPGEYVEGVEIETQQGDNKVTVVVSDDEGRKGLKKYVDIYTGVVMPMPVDEICLDASEDMKSVTISWTGPTEGVDGGYINPDKVSYTVWVLTPSSWGEYWEVLEEVGTATSFTFEPSKQDIIYLGVSTSNEAGTTEEIKYGSILAGPPYSLPFEETFVGSDECITDTEPWVIYPVAGAENDGIWSLRYLADQDPFLWQESDEKALFAVTDVPNAETRVGMPRFSTVGEEDIVLQMDLYVSDGAQCTLKGELRGMVQPLVIEMPSVDCQDGEWQPVTVRLPLSFGNAQWVQLYLDAAMSETTSYVGVKNISLTTASGVGLLIDSKQDRWAAGGNGIIKICSDSESTVFTPSGQIIKTIFGNAQINVGKGIYIVKLKGKTCKVIVK